MYLYCVKYYPSLLKNTIQLAENLLRYVKFEFEWKLFQGQTNVFVRKNSSAFSIITLTSVLVIYTFRLDQGWNWCAVCIFPGATNFTHLFDSDPCACHIIKG